MGDGPTKPWTRSSPHLRRETIRLSERDRFVAPNCCRVFRRNRVPAGLLTHPNLVVVYRRPAKKDACTTSPMELVDGNKRASAARRRPEFRLPRVLRIWIKLSSALHRAPIGHVVHRDLAR